MTKKTTTPKKEKEIKTTDINDALFGLQSENLIIPRNGKGVINGREYRYATLDDVITIIRPFMQKYGMIFTQVPTDGNLVTTISHVKSKTSLDSKIELGNPNSSQELGARITYLRRYSLTSMLGLSTEEDVDASNKDLKPALPPINSQVPVSNPVAQTSNTKSAPFEKAELAILSCKTLEAMELIQTQVGKSTRLNDEEKKDLNVIINEKMAELKKILD